MPGRVLLLVTADHGQVDCPPERTVEFTNHLDLLATLAVPPTGEARLPYLHAKEGRLEGALDYLDDHLKDVSDWVLTEEALKPGLFGPRTTANKKGRLGDVILLPRDNYCFTHADLPGPPGIHRPPRRSHFRGDGRATPLGLSLTFRWIRGV